MKSGIYVIRNKATNHVYIGQSISVHSRIRAHKNKLSRQKHENEYLQNSFNKYGITNFEFEIIELVEESLLNEREIFYIAKFKSSERKYGYNLVLGGKSGGKLCEDGRKKRSGAGNPMYGKKHSEEVVQRMREATWGTNNKLTIEQVGEIKRRLADGCPPGKLFDGYKVSRSTVSKIATLVNWSWVDRELNEKILTYARKRRAN